MGGSAVVRKEDVRGLVGSAGVKSTGTGNDLWLGDEPRGAVTKGNATTLWPGLGCCLDPSTGVHRVVLRLPKPATAPQWSSAQIRFTMGR